MESIKSPNFRTEELSLKDYKKIIHAVNQSAGIDLSDYAISSMRRRFTRYILNNKIRDFDEFASRIANGNGFVNSLIEELTVNTTEMFRDPTFWTRLSREVISVIENKDRIRIWHAACSTGEEVFSMAILLEELGMLDKASIVATDINRHVLEVAGKGIYPLRSQKVNSSNYDDAGGIRTLDYYYQVKDNEVHYNTDLIRNVEFKYHDLVKDGVFSQFDLIICRNVLIYFNFELQERVIHDFSESLNKGGFLGIGSKESIIWCKAARNFSVISLNESIFRNKGICHNK